jgi:hypothetical protein
LKNYSDIEKKFFDLVKKISDINNFGILERDDEYLNKLIELIIENSDHQTFFEKAFLGIAKDFKFASPIVIRSAMEVLKWKSVQQGLYLLIEASDSERYRHMLRGILRAYNEND